VSPWWALVVAGGLLGGLLWPAWRDRRDFVRVPGTFRCRVRLRSAALPGFPSRWTRLPRHARWVHDVLVVRSGLLRPRLHVLPVHVAEGELVELDRLRVRGLGPRPVSVRILLDDGAAVEVASTAADQALLAGPFVVLAVSRLR
jgi:hypothetical protein